MSTEVDNTNANNGAMTPANDPLADLIAQASAMDAKGKAELLARLGIQVSGSGVARIPKAGETVFDKVRVYPSEKGGVHFQGIPGASQKYGLTLYSATIEWLFKHFDEITLWMDENSDKLTTKPEKTN